ncbi:MAG: DUF255 domain-containing protein [Polyangiaceae bacterium]
MVREGTPPEVDLSLARARNAERPFTWLPYEKASFDLAAKEGKLVLLDGAAEWCHWCHVMDETTYKDPEIGRILNERFVAIRVDIDEHPDMAERYGAWGWPATILLTADGRELGKLRGYVPAGELAPTLRQVVADASAATTPGPDPGALAATVDDLPWTAAFALFSLDDYYDDKGSGWGFRQKSALGENLEMEARRAARGDDRARVRALATTNAQRALLDPVWGGVYQYSDDGVWNHPHFEKLMPYQAVNLEAYAAVYRATGDSGARADAELVARYMTTFLRAPDGSFYVNQDADVGAHDPSVPFIDGHVYYAKTDAERRALGIPWIDRSVYAHDNGLAIAALVALSEATGDPSPLAAARAAADSLLRTHVGADGRVLHEAEGRKLMYLPDAAAFGRALARLARVTNEPRYREVALQIAAAMERELAAPNGGFFGASADPDAVGVFAERRQPFDANVLAARFFAELARTTQDEAWFTRGKRVLAAASTPRMLATQGRLLGGYALACDELGLTGRALGAP